MKKLKSGLLLLLMLGLTLPVAAQAQSGLEIARNMQSVYSAMQTFAADFTQELRHQEAGTTETRQGRLLFAKPLLVRWETFAPYPELLLLTNTEIWNYLPDEDLAYRYNLDAANDSRAIMGVITGQTRLDAEFEIEVNPVDPAMQNALHLTLYPFEPTYQMVEAQIWLDPSTYLLRKAQIMDFYGNTNSITFTSLTPGVSHPAGTFEFTPPPGIDVEDQRN